MKNSDDRSFEKTEDILMSDTSDFSISEIKSHDSFKTDITDIITAIITFFAIYFTFFRLNENTVDCYISLVYFLFSALNLCIVAVKERKFRKEAVFPAVLLFLIILSFSLFSSFDILRMLLSCYLFGYTLCALKGISSFPLSGIEDIYFQLSALFFTPIKNVFLPAVIFFKKLSSLKKTKSRRFSKFAGILLGIILAIPVFSIVTELLQDADFVFHYAFTSVSLVFDDISDFIADNIPLNFDNLLPAVLLTPFVFSFIFCAKHGITKTAEDKARAKQTIKKLAFVNPSVFFGFYALISLIYVFFIGTQITYLSAAFSGTLPYGYSLSSYARQGFFEMSAVAAINLLLIIAGEIFCRRNNNNELPKTRKYFSLFFCIFTMLLIIIAAAKMGLYVSAFGLTENRLAVLLADCILFISFALIIIMLFRKDFPAIRIIFRTAVTAVCVMLVLSLSSVAAVFNTEMYLSGRHKKTDTDTIRSSDSLIIGAYCLDRLTDCDSPVTAEDAKRQLYNLWSSKKYFLKNTDTVDVYLFKKFYTANEQRIQSYKTTENTDRYTDITYHKTEQNYTCATIFLILDMPERVREIKIENSLFTKTIRNSDGSPFDAGENFSIYDWCIADGNGEFAIITLITESNEKHTFELRRYGSFVSDDPERCLSINMTDHFSGYFRAKPDGYIYLTEDK